MAQEFNDEKKSLITSSFGEWKVRERKIQCKFFSPEELSAAEAPGAKMLRRMRFALYCYGMNDQGAIQIMPEVMVPKWTTVVHDSPEMEVTLYGYTTLGQTCPIFIDIEFSEKDKETSERHKFFYNHSKTAAVTFFSSNLKRYAVLWSNSGATLQVLPITYHAFAFHPNEDSLVAVLDQSSSSLYLADFAVTSYSISLRPRPIKACGATQAGKCKRTECGNYQPEKFVLVR